MNAPIRPYTAPIAGLTGDIWSMEYSFEEIEISEDGIHFGSFWGTAELALNDQRDRDFYVRHIAINGQKRERKQLRTSEGFWFTHAERTDAVLLLTMPAKDCQTFKAHLFRAIEKALYASVDAAERFSSELEDAL